MTPRSDMTYLLVIQRLVEVFIVGSILCNPNYESQRSCLWIALGGGYLWVLIRLIAITMYGDTAVPMIGYVLLPGLIFLWMLLFRGAANLVRRIYWRRQAGSN